MRLLCARLAILSMLAFRVDSDTLLGFCTGLSSQGLGDRRWEWCVGAAGAEPVRPTQRLLALRGGGDDLMKSVTQSFAQAQLEKALKERVQHEVANKVKAAVANKLVQGVKHMEQQIDDQLIEEGEMSDEELEKLREARINRMKKARRAKDLLHRLGHGSYHECDQEAFFDLTRKSPRVVVHFWRPSSFRCDIMHKHIRDICRLHTECLFISVNVEKAPFLVQRLNIKVLPCLKLVKKGEIFHTMFGFEEFGGTDDFKAKDMVQALVARGMLTPEDQDSNDVSGEEVSLDLEDFD